jgi:solute carrier family 50 protein (sugar transporter)
VAISIFCTLTTFALADFSIKKTMTNILCLEAIALPILGILTSFACADNTASMLSLWGLAGNFISLVYYAAPLSSMAEVIKKRDSSSILLPLTLMNTANAFLWTTYGLAISDAYVFVPNGIGALLSLAQLALSFIYPPKGTSNRSGLVA